MLWRDKEKTGKIVTSGYSSYVSDEAKKEYETWAERVGKKLHPELGGLLTEEEWDEAKSSILNAFYTSREVIENGIWPIIERLGFKGGTILEPSAGVGHILGLMPREHRRKLPDHGRGKRPDQRAHPLQALSGNENLCQRI